MFNSKNCLGSLGMITVAVLATTFGAGCTGSAEAKDATAGEATAAITSTGTTTEGCNGSARYDITSEEEINYIAVDRSDYSDVKMELYTVDESGNETRVNEEATEVDTAMQSMLDAASNNSNASQSSRDAANDSASHRATSTETESSDHEDDSTSFNDAEHKDTSAANANNNANSNESGSSGSSGSASASASNNAASNATKSGNTASASNRNSASKTTTTSDSSDRAANSASDSSSASNNAAERKATSEASQSRTHHLVFSHLESMHSKHIVIRMEMTADENKETTRIFTGSSEKHVSSQSDFEGSYPQCTEGSTGTSSSSSSSGSSGSSGSSSSSSSGADASTN